MTSAINSGLAGLRAAEARAAVRAQNIVNWQSEKYRPLTPVQTTTEAGAPIVHVRPIELSGDFAFVDIAAELVDMRMAKHAYRASANVLRTAEEMSKTLLDTFA